MPKETISAGELRFLDGDTPAQVKDSDFLTEEASITTPFDQKPIRVPWARLLPTKTRGWVRVGNKRAGSRAKPIAGETAIDGDRKNPILGNRHILHDHNNPQERHMVIENYRIDYEADWLRHGPMARETERLAARVANGENFILMCWCEPRPCHCHIIKAKIAELITRRTQPEGIHA